MKYIIIGAVVATLLLLVGLDFIYQGKLYNIIFGNQSVNIDNSSTGN